MSFYFSSTAAATALIGFYFVMPTPLFNVAAHFEDEDPGLDELRGFLPLVVCDMDDSRKLIVTQDSRYF